MPYSIDIANLILGDYSISNLGPALVFVAVAASEAALAPVGHPLIPKHAEPLPISLDGTSTPFLWVDANIQTATG